MGFKKELAEGVLTEWGRRLGHKIFGKEIPQEVVPMFTKRGISPVDAQTFGRAMEFDPEVREGLDGLFRSASSGNDDAYMLMEAAAKNFSEEDKIFRTLDRTQKNISKRQRKAYHSGMDKIDATPTATGSAGRSATAYTSQIGETAPMSTGIGVQAPVKQATPVDYSGSSQYSGGQANPRAAGDTITEVHHGGPLDKLMRLVTQHQSYQGVTPNSPSPLIEMGDRLFGVKIGNSPQNTVDILGMLTNKGRQSKKLALHEQVGSVMHEKTIDDLLGSSDFNPREYRSSELGQFEHLKSQGIVNTLDEFEKMVPPDTGGKPGKTWPKGSVTTKIDIWKPGANIRTDTPLETIKLTPETYPKRVELAFDALKRNGIEGVDEFRGKWDNKLAKVDPKDEILGYDHNYVHKLIDELEKVEGSALNTLNKMSDDEIFNLPIDEAFKLYIRQMQEAETILANVLQYRYQMIEELFKEMHPNGLKGLGESFDDLGAAAKQSWFRQNVNTIAVKGDVAKAISLKKSMKPIDNWNNHIADTFGWSPQSLWTTIEEIEAIARELSSKDQPAPMIQ